MGRWGARVVGAAVLIASNSFSPALAQPPKCFGEVATIVGSSGDDKIQGTQGDDVIVTHGGNDQIDGRGGDDVICSGKGGDGVEAGAGADRIATAGSGDYVEAGAGADEVITGKGKDSVSGGAGDDRIDTGPRGDMLGGGPGNDLLDGGPELDNNQGDELLFFETDGPVTVDLSAGTASGDGEDSLVEIDGSWGTSFSDTFVGDEDDNDFYGGSLVTKLGQCGSDTFFGAGGNDQLNDFDAEDCAENEDRMEGGAGFDAIYGSFGNDHLLGGDDPDIVQGGPGDDRLEGGDNHADWGDTLEAADGDDVIDGGPGELDQVAFFNAEEGVVVDLAAGRATGNGTDTLLNLEAVEGSHYDDHLMGDDDANLMNGDSGKDRIEGRGGDDLIAGDYDSDMLWGGAGNDTIVGGNVCGSPVEPECFGDDDPGNDVIAGDEGDDWLMGVRGDDSLDGGEGTDRLDGGPGTDGCTNGEQMERCEDA